MAATDLKLRIAVWIFKAVVSLELNVAKADANARRER
jgi:hypothetical protein